MSQRYRNLHNNPWSYDKENWFVRIEKYQPYAENIWDKNTGGKYKVVTQPIAETPIIKNNSVTGAIQAVSVTSQHPEEAVKFLDLLNTDEYLRNLVDKGIEGTHYKELDDGKIQDLTSTCGTLQHANVCAWKSLHSKII